MFSGLGSIAKFYKRLHKWPGLVISFVLLYYSITGIFMNHRDFFSGLDVDRNNLPEEFRYANWNNSALKGNLIISPDSILVFGTIGIWVTDSAFKNYRPLNMGFPEGADNHKVFDLHRCPDGHLYAATQFGLFGFDANTDLWNRFNLDTDISRFVAVESIQDTLYVLNRSYMFKGKSEGINSSFAKKELKPAANTTNDISLFETIWQIHSGEIFGIPGKIFVDCLGIVTAFLSISGIIYFFFPGWIKSRRHKRKAIKNISSLNRWSLKWHNYLGAWTFVFLIILFFTGMFLRPPLLITIARSKIKPVKFSHLDQPNPWYDKLRDLKYDVENDRLLLATSEGMYFMDKEVLLPHYFEIQPPVSVMGINAFEAMGGGAYLIGSFSGLFAWHPSHPEILNYALGKKYEGSPSGRPVGDFKVTGLISDISGNQYMVDYDKGIIPLYHGEQFPKMPGNIVKASKMSLWNLSLEIHTGRFFKFLMSDFYILLVPLTGLTGIMVVLSGYLLWRKRYRKRAKTAVVL